MKTECESERFNFIQSQSGLSKKDFAESLGLSKSHGYHIACGNTNASREVLERLAKVYQVNLNWYISGEGEPCGKDENLSEGPPENSALITLLDQQAAAGRGREIEDYSEERSLKVPLSLIAPHRPERLRAVFVSGDSMIGENICNGDIAVFSPGLVQGNGIYIVSINRALVVKRVCFDNRRRTIELISANPAYPPRLFSGPRLEDLKIEGRMVACVHRM